MAFDGIVISNIVYELNNTITGGRLYKIAQPESDELLLTFKTGSGQFRLILSANASLPLAYLTDDNKVSPQTAPNFCMLLRKHLNNGRVVSITQPEFERIIDIEVEHLDEMGDLCRKHIIAEFMGKHSNIILVDDNNTILDSIKHISSQLSSVREVLPGRNYFIPKTTDKINPLTVSKEDFFNKLYIIPEGLAKAIYTTFTGFSKVVGEELCYRSGIDGNKPSNCLNDIEKEALWVEFLKLTDMINNAEYSPVLIKDNSGPVEFSAFKLSMYDNNYPYNSISSLVIDYYRQKEIITRIRHKSTDIRKIITTLLERSYKKLDIQERQIQDTQKRDKYRIYGELITTYGYNIVSGDTELITNNYYDNNNEIRIPLDKELTPIENANKYFARYNKLKRTYEAGTRLIIEIKEEIMYLESILNSLDIATTDEDLSGIKDELIETGYIKRGANTKRKLSKNKPLHYISTDGFDIYVGKNNIQNEELTFKFANNSDWWFHAKQMPGSHVILKTEGKEVPDRAFEEAAALAAHYSKGKDQEKVEIDYCLRKEIKKPAGSKPGFVVYYTNYSLIAIGDISALKLID